MGAAAATQFKIHNYSCTFGEIPKQFALVSTRTHRKTVRCRR